MHSAPILVTGGTGFLGRHLVPMLLARGESVRVLTRRPEEYGWLARCASQQPCLAVCVGDVQDAESVLRAADGCSAIIHAAGLFRFWGDERAFTATNVNGTENIVRAAANVARLVHVSTVALIGQPDPNCIVDETHPARPADAYQRSKLAAEMVVRRAFDAGQVRAVIARPGAYYGEYGQYAFNRLFFRDPMRGIIMQVNGGRYITFPAYIRDVAHGVILSLTRGRDGEIYNICGACLTHKEAFDIVCDEARLRLPRLAIPGWLGVETARALTALATLTGREPFYPISLKSYVYNDWRVSNDKARRELGFVPIDFREGARRTIAWYRAGQPDQLSDTECV
jgi:nucleoside-diphosphate-sugar epimerase